MMNMLCMDISMMMGTSMMMDTSKKKSKDRVYLMDTMKCMGNKYLSINHNLSMSIKEYYKLTSSNLFRHLISPFCFFLNEILRAMLRVQRFLNFFLILLILLIIFYRCFTIGLIIFFITLVMIILFFHFAHFFFSRVLLFIFIIAHQFIFFFFIFAIRLI